MIRMRRIEKADHVEPLAVVKMGWTQGLLAGRWVSVKAGAVLQDDQRPWEDLDEDEKDL